MKKLVILLMLSILNLAISQNKIFPFKINKVVLENGLTVLSVPFDSPGIIAYYTVVRAGSRNEVEPGKSGFAHFFEHMMFRGTDKYPEQVYNDILKRLGADSNAFTTADWTAYHIVASSDALETIIDIESDRFMNLKYTVEQFKTEAGAILGEYNKSASSPFLSIYEKLQDLAFTTHTYKHTTIGFLKDILDMPNQYDYSLQFFDRYYRPENCAIVVVGDFDQNKLIELVKKYYGSWKRGGYKPDIPVEPPQTEEKVGHIAWKGKTLPYLAIAYHVPEFSTKNIERASIDFISELLFSKTAPLYQKLVIEKQWVDFIQGEAPDRRDPFLFVILARIKRNDLIDSVKNEIFNAIEELKTKPVSKERLEQVKSYLKYSFAMSLDNPNSVAYIVGHYFQLTGDPESVNELYSLYEKVTPQDIMRAVQKYFTKENRTIVTLTEEEK
ncbi:zinc protease [Candidatus Kryptobacter tengchongensis]|uniref:M16 family metallopeptidase n=1 Tax=Kryptobacter tengchongensis TaxID=1643429 RepID=UPI0007073EA4|nr:pitrilysin family protein [Candidatus Kryptobacter tengchongensis]CUS90741.1 zinc protease [Candidatus Kryptobacter tengchongensis]CUU10224.1 zinc protease [Candidatus Kryptobacter tengchongensis]